MREPNFDFSAFFVLFTYSKNKSCICQLLRARGGVYKYGHFILQLAGRLCSTHSAPVILSIGASCGIIKANKKPLGLGRRTQL